MASLPATESPGFREEFDTVSFSILEARPRDSLTLTLFQEYEDVQLTAYLSSLTKSANILNDVSPWR
jgi:COP9 signalosome complex subunit 6